MTPELQAVAALFGHDHDAERVEAVDAARAAGHTWQEIAVAMGYSDRRDAQQWRRRKGQ